MSTVLARDHAADPAVDKLREELSDLQGAMASLSETLDQTNRVRRVAEDDLARHRALLAEALDLRVVLEDRLVELETELAATRRLLGRQRLLSAIRAKLLADIGRSSWWRRGTAMRRAARVEHLLT